MRTAFFSFLCTVLLATVAVAQEKNTAPDSAIKAIPGFDLNALDKTADPCEDFYQYACGTWIKEHPVPPDRGRYGRFDELQEHNQAVLRDILEKAAAPDPKRSAVMQKIGDYYASCMDEQKIDALGAKPIAAELDRVAALKTRADLVDELAHLHMIGVDAVFNMYPNVDLHNARMMVANVDQGGLAMPDRDYYLKEDAKFQEIRKDYLAHV